VASDAAPFSRFATNVRKKTPQMEALSASRSSSNIPQTTNAQDRVSKAGLQPDHRGGGGASAAVKTMTSRQYEAFK